MIRPGVVGAIIRKDVGEFIRDRFFVLMTLLSIVFYPLLFWALPGSVDETITLGITDIEIGHIVAPVSGGSAGIELVEYPDKAALEIAVLEGSDGVVAGIAFPASFLSTVAAGQATTVELLLTADVQSEIEALMSGIVTELAYALAGEVSPVNPVADAVILGTDRVGDQVSFREELRPLLAFFVLMVETFALASLVAIEVQQRTVAAVLVTPATTADFITAKGVIGTSIAFVETLLIVLLIGGLAAGAPIMVVALLLGAGLVTGFGMIAGAYGRDFISVLFISMALMIPLMIPAFAALYPGTAAGWVQALPSYGLVETIVRVTTEGAGWAVAAPTLLLLAAWCAAAFTAGALILRRKVATL